MNLQKQISRIQEMMGVITENNLPLNIRRRLNTSIEENLHHLKDYVMRYYQPDRKESTISRAFYENSHRLLNKIEQEDEDYWDKEVVERVKDFLESQFKEEMESFYDSLFGGEDDTGIYCFIKHSDRHMRLETNRGFSECVSGWHNFLRRYGFWFPDLDWNEQKVRLDENPNKTILIKKPLEGHNYEYYFSIIKK